LTIVGNTVRVCAGSNINLNNVVGGVVSHNSCDLAGFSGITWSECNGLKVDNNYVTRSGLSAMRDVIASVNVDVTDNKIVDCATLATAGDQHGLFIQGLNNYNIRGNRISDANAKMLFGMYLIDADNSKLSLDNNTVTESITAGLRLGSTTALRSYQGNLWRGTAAATFNDPTLPACTQVGNTLTIPTGHKVLSVPLAAPITSILTNGHGGAVIVLHLAAGVDLRTGLGNIFIGSTFVATANSTIMLSCDGTNWRQVSRSAN
jgi:hypothetical protein